MGNSLSIEQALVGVGKGWELLVRGLYAMKPPEVDVVQVKEKFGGLRFYVENCPAEFARAIGQAEYLSIHTCEMCGEPAIRQSLPGGNWTKTICAACWSAVKEERKKDGLHE